MDPESKKMLQETFALAEENNNMLKSLRRSMRTARFMSYIYWIFIVGSAIGAYYFIEPYLDSLKSGYGGAIDTFRSFGQ